MDNQNNSYKICSSHGRRLNNYVPLLRQIRYLLEYRKGVVLSFLFVIFVIGHLVYFPRRDIKSQNLKKEDVPTEVVLNDVEGQMSKPDMIQFLTVQDEEFKRRRTKMSDVCKNLTEGSPKYKPRNETLKFDILWDHHYRLAYCPIPRTGLTVWNRYFITMAHIPYWPQWLTKMWWLVRKMYNMPDCLSRDEMGQIVNKSLTFTFVRHPFIRLVAVYNDRIMTNFNNWQKEILKRQGRSNGAGKNSAEEEIKFKDFVDFILNDGAGDTEHLDTYYHHCDMCRLRYDLIGKFESFANDTKYVLLKSGAHETLANDDLLQQLSWFNNRPYSSTNLETALPFFRELKKETILKLYLRYEMDFEMFGYDAEPFYEQGIAS